ncbi:UNVERIFIED_CONTAM: hypothetical protein FKN15_024345 [Acipenser sinensis]
MRVFYVLNFSSEGFPACPQQEPSFAEIRKCTTAATLRPRTGHAGSMKVTAPYVSFSCPEGANVTLKCSLYGHLADIHDKVGRNWLFSAGRNPQCKERVHPRHVKDNGTHTGVFLSSNHKGTFFMTLANLTVADQGGYCCYVYDITMEHNKPHQLGSDHGYIELNVTQTHRYHPRVPSADRFFTRCRPAMQTTQSYSVGGQRSSGQALNVEGRSEALGHENPVFDEAPPPSVKTRSATQIMMRQSSETGRHLLSEPGTPLSPPALGDCFFPSQVPYCKAFTVSCLPVPIKPIKPLPQHYNRNGPNYQSTLLQGGTCVQSTARWYASPQTNKNIPGHGFGSTRGGDTVMEEPSGAQHKDTKPHIL